jgi:DNA-binding CsgD family transcriptional regulator
MPHLEDDLQASTDLATLWRLLCEGRLRVSEATYRDGRCIATLEQSSGPKLAREHLGLLQRCFEGESQKVLSIELGVSVATIAGRFAQTLRCLHARCHASRVPIIMIMAALACGGFRQRRAQMEARGQRSCRVSVEVPGRTLRDRLAPSEWKVASLAIEGATYRDIARERGRSERTVANQLAAAFDKLGISGRAELRAMAVREASAASGASRGLADPVSTGSICLVA